MIEPAIIGSIADRPCSRANDSGEGSEPEPPPGPCGPGSGAADGVPCGNSGESVWVAGVLTDPLVTEGSEPPGNRVLLTGVAVEGGCTGDVRLGQPLGVGLGVPEGSVGGSAGGVVGSSTVGSRVGISVGGGRGGASMGGGRGGALIGGGRGGALIGPDWVGRGWSLLGSGRGAGLSLGSGGFGSEGSELGPVDRSGFGSSGTVAVGRGLAVQLGAQGSSLGSAKTIGAASRVAASTAATPHPAARDHRPSRPLM